MAQIFVLGIFAGKKVAVLESRVVGAGQSGRDTGEISTYNNHTYKKLDSLYGSTKTQQIAESQKAALEFVEEVVKQKKINCGFSRQDAYVFFEDPSVGPEFKAILNAGLHDTKEVCTWLAIVDTTNHMNRCMQCVFHSADE